jgi:hypothetical protein
VIPVDRARALLGEAGRRLSDEEILRKCKAASALARLTYDLLQREHREAMTPRAERGAA